MSPLFCLLLGIMIGFYLGFRYGGTSLFAQKDQVRAICKKFSCKSNEFTYFLENDSGDYIVSLHNEEYRVKFSLSRPTQIVFCQSVERVEG
ncbi:hypothetical protein [Enterococcus sp. 5B3_DIV0040]|uniref:hypothetical protein n=1 Tax=Enterococcus sp. 5B3_DIV0040 TaxID=1834182 RepID=UPI000B6C12BB|nr:hypothetical protein [Enterococcus sp. 5B3_DIV0040]OTO05104.1 hypothetical protein A5883_002094 [Enterococcus sp. 5B3_DIV0040]